MIRCCLALGEPPPGRTGSWAAEEETSNALRTAAGRPPERGGASTTFRIAPKEQPEHRPPRRTPEDDAAMGGLYGQAKPLCTSELNPPASTAEDSATYSLFTFHLRTMPDEFATEEKLFLLHIAPESIHLFRKERGVFLTGRAHYVFQQKCVPTIF